MTVDQVERNAEIHDATATARSGTLGRAIAAVGAVLAVLVGGSLAVSRLGGSPAPETAPTKKQSRRG